MNRHKIYAIAILILCFIIVFQKESYANSNKSKIYNNIYIENIDMSGLTKEEAIDKLKESIYCNKEINFLYDEHIYPLSFDFIELNYNIEDTVEKAFNIGRNKNIVDNTKIKINLKLGDKINFRLEPKYNNEKINDYIEILCSQINKEPVDATINIEQDNIKVTEEVIGIKINKDTIRESIIDKIDELDFNETSIPINIIKPKYTYENLSKINSVLGSYKTKFNLSNYNRSNNIYIATNKTNNILLNNNEEFSFNNIIGQRSEQAGFKEAPVIINGEMQSGLGGGICQVSSTIYNAVLYSGLEITEARNHSIPSSYIEKGRDATVSYGAVDLKFRNNYQYPILIQNKVINDTIVTTIYGNDRYKREIDIVTELVETIPNKTIIKESSVMYNGENFIQEKGRSGYKIKTYRIYKNKNGEILSKEYINESYYPPINKIIIKGTKIRYNGIIV